MPTPAPATNIDKRVQVLVEEAFPNHEILEVSNGSENGNNFLGLISEVTVSKKKEDHQHDTSYIILKTAPQEEYNRKVFPIRDIYQREIFTYNDILSEFLKIQVEKKLTAGFQTFPKIYLTSSDNLQEALLMENMKKKGFKHINHRVGIDYPHALLVMKELGKFHALSYAMRDQKPKIFNEWADDCAECFFSNNYWSDLAIKAISKLTKDVINSFPPNEHEEERKALEKFVNILPTVYKNIFVIKEDDRKYAVINHGDLEIRNLLFKYGDFGNTEIPTELSMLDWQLARFASPALDILFFIFVCTDKGLREHYYMQLIESYYQSLSDFLEKLGSDPKTALPYEVLLQHLEKFAGFGLFTAIWFNATNLKESDDVPDYYSTDCDDVLVTMMTTVPKRGYLQRTRDVVTDMIKYGYRFTDPLI
ncbi:hypothetical protein RI129_008565 [Pyrocoelia pectoralis]|uniref:CHK kinase-like domain-containing protein n=1 Tax=Pyrocoelia pectoralis TaxID=417401 RepID=A0AAN7ZK96_9COLE